MTARLHRRRLLVLAGSAALAASCAPAVTTTTPSASAPSSPLAANPARDIWPAAYLSAPPYVREAYAYAAGRPRSLSFIPCYCGCGASGHRNNQDCYVKEFRSGGWLILDTHGFG